MKQSTLMSFMPSTFKVKIGLMDVTNTIEAIISIGYVSRMTIPDLQLYLLAYRLASSRNGMET